MTESGSTNPQGAGDSEEKKKRRAALWAWWRRYDTWSGRWDWLNWLTTSKAGVMAATAAAGVAAVAAGATVYTLYFTGGSRLIAVASQKLGDSSILYPVEGRDKAGRRAKFDIVTLTKAYGWVRASTHQLAREGEIYEGTDVLNRIFDAPVKESFSHALSVIAAGVASQEGETEAETIRAANRAKQSAEWLVPVLPASLPIWTLNLGQYKKPCAECETSGTDWQRPFIVIAVREIEPDTNLGEALADALSGKSNLPSPESYSAYDLSRFR